MFRSLESAHIDGTMLATNLQKYNGSSPDPVRTVGYLIATLFTETPQSFYLQVALIKSLEDTMKKISQGAYKFVLLPFLETFWFKRITDKPDDISDKSFWNQNSIPYYRAATEDKKAKMMFRILSNHIKDIKVTNELENWIDQ
jgi:hypothetical protein